MTEVGLLVEKSHRVYLKQCVCAIFVAYIPFRKLRGVTPAKRRNDVVK